MRALSALLIVISIGAALSAGACSSRVSDAQRSATTFRSAEITKLRVAPMDRTGSDGNFRSLKSSASTDGLPTKLAVYKVVPANIKRSWVQGRGAKLGLTGAIAEDATRFVMRSRAATFEVEKESGSFDYTTDQLSYQTDPIRNLLSDEDYRARAEEFLTESGLMYAQAEFRDVNRGNVTAVYENGEWIERPYMIEVRFSHKPLDGVPFDKGVGPKIVVQFGEDGKLLGATSIWRHVRRDREYHLKTPRDAIEDARKGRGKIFDVASDSDGVVQEISIGYLNEPAGYSQLYVLPAYVMKGKLNTGSEFAAVVRAIPDEQLLIDGSLGDDGVEAPLSQGPK